MDRHISWSPINLEDTWAGINSKPGTLGTCTSLCPLWVRGNRKCLLSWYCSESTAPLELQMLRKHLRLEEIITISISILKWCFDSVCVLSMSVNNYKVLTQCAVPKLPHSSHRAGMRTCTLRSLQSSSLDLNKHVCNDGRRGTLEAFKESENSKRQRQHFTQFLSASVEHTKWFHWNQFCCYIFNSSCINMWVS